MTGVLPKEIKCLARAACGAIGQGNKDVETMASLPLCDPAKYAQVTVYWNSLVPPFDLVPLFLVVFCASTRGQNHELEN